jgi:hypothetical protein
MASLGFRNPSRFKWYFAVTTTASLRYVKTLPSNIGEEPDPILKAPPRI